MSKNQRSDGWNQKPLIEVATLQRGYDLPVSQRISGNVPVFAANGPIGTHNQSRVKGPGVVTGRSGSIGKVHYVEKDYWPLNTALFVNNFHGNDPKYVYYLLKVMRLERYSEGTGVPTLNRNNIHGISVSLPPLTEQKRIAAILEKADAIRKKRKQVIELTETFLRSAFLEMFGDPVTNPKEWEVQKLVDLCVPKIGLKAGPFGSALKKEVYTKFGYRIYGQEQVIAGTLDVGNYYVSKSKFKQLSSCAVKPGDLLISLVGSIGNTLVVPDEFEPGIINPRLIRIRTNKDLLAPLYLQWVLKQDSLQNVLGRRSHGGTMPVLNASMLKELWIPVPPIAFQEEFLALLTKADSSFAKAELLDEKADDLFNSLVQRAFRGEL